MTWREHLAAAAEGWVEEHGAPPSREVKDAAFVTLAEAVLWEEVARRQDGE